MTISVYVCASDRMSWGRGMQEWEAIAHAVSHGGRCKKLMLFEVKVPDGTEHAESKVSVDEMGRIHAPAGSEVKEVATIDNAGRLSEHLQDLFEMVEQRLYPDET